MSERAIKDFQYYVGIRSLADIATKEDRVCVLNILGNESRGVTPTSHVYSGGNIVFGTSPGRRGEFLETKISKIPVFNNVREGLEAGHHFNVGVVYLPPAAVRDGVFELIRVNKELRKIVILTEKISVHDAREIRAFGQAHKIDIFGANSLGVADSWNHVRIGGALGGDNPDETLRKGSIAIYSNSGNFTTTIASYLKTGGWGTTTCISSGKDFYIHYGPAEFAYALANDDRTKAAVMYVEPGGYYEQNLALQKPVVACVVGRWKAKLTRAVGHAGAISGGDESAEAKEKWFMRHFDVGGIYTADKPIVSKKGAVVTDISLIPAALSDVMKLNGIEPDFAPEGNLSLKPWFGNNCNLNLPPELDIPLVEAIQPYRDQISGLTRQVGAIFPRRSMKDCSGSSIMDPKTQVTLVSGISILDAARQTLESNLCLALMHEPNDANRNALFNIALASQLNLHGDAMLDIVEAARAGGSAPNTVIGAACCALGPARAKAADDAVDALVDLFAYTGLERGDAQGFDFSKVKASADQLKLLAAKSPDAKAQAMLDAYKARGGKSVFVDYLQTLGNPVADAVLAALTTTIAWESLMRKRISRTTVHSLPWYAKLFAAIIGVSVDRKQHKADSFCGVPMADILKSWTATELAYLALFGEKPAPEQLFPFQTMLGLIISNGPGTISAQGAKGAVSADGPETPERIHIHKAMVGFLTHTGFAHGGNGFEGIQFLIDRFSATNLEDPGNPDHGIDLKAMAILYANAFKADKAARKAVGEETESIPGINHPIFKGQPVNNDPREVYLSQLFEERGEYNIFHAFYKELVKALFDVGATKNVFCVNIDAVIAALLLKLMWPRYRGGEASNTVLQDAAFTAFLFGRMVGCAGEIDDHTNRGRNMDTRTPASMCSFVS